MTFSFSNEYVEALQTEVRRNRGWLHTDPFCKVCGDYRSNHATPVGAGRALLCLFAPTYFKAMTHDEWASGPRRKP